MRRRRKGRMIGEFWSRENELLSEGTWAVESVGGEVLLRLGGKRQETRYALTPNQAAGMGLALAEHAGHARENE